MESLAWHTKNVTELSASLSSYVIKKYLHEILNKRSPPGELVGLLTDSLFTIRFLGFLSGSL